MFYLAWVGGAPLDPVDLDTVGDIGAETIVNLEDTTDLVSGLTYELFGAGLPAGAQGTFDGGTSLALLTPPTTIATGVPINISKGRTYPDGGAFDEDLHLVEDEEIFSLEITHAEGGFASLTVEIRNPRIGLLAAGRNLWVWLSWRDSTDTVRPLFHGRLVGVPENLEDEVVRLLFIARPNDFIAQKMVLANSLRSAPHWDPLWLTDGVGDSDTVLETRTAFWHIDPRTLLVSASDITAGEDGTIEIDESEHFYDGMTVSYGTAPLRRVNVTGTVTWTQTGSGDVDLTDELVAAFREAGSPYEWPKISSYMADGLVNEWPKPEASLGGGWTIGNATAATLVPTLFKDLSVDYTDKTGDATWTTEVKAEVSSLVIKFFPHWTNVNVVFTLGAINANLTVHYEAARKRTEIVSFVVSADVQPILTDPMTADEESISLSSTFVDQPVDPPGAMPIGDLRRNCFFPTDRGQLSLQYLMLLAAAKLRARARAVDITCASTWEKLAGVVTCRKNVLLNDGRLPGGQATGKVKSYRLAADGAGQMIAEVTIGCTIGYGDVIVAANGQDTYADDYAVGYTETIGAQVSVIAGELVYDALDGTYVIDDDGVDLFNMSPTTVINSLVVSGGPTDQETAIADALEAPGMVAVGVGDAGLLTGLSASAVAVPGTYTIHLTTASRFTVTDPNDVVIGRGALGVAFHAAGLGFTLAVGGSDCEISVTSEPAGTVGLVPDPITALSELPTTVALDLVPVTGGDFETVYTIRVLPLVIPQTIDLEAAA